MRRVNILLAIVVVVFCSELHAQNRIENFYTLIISSNINKNNEYITFTKDSIVKTVIEYRQDVLATDSRSDDIDTSIHYIKLYKGLGPKIDACDLVNYARDTVYLFSTGSHFSYTDLVITSKGKLLIQGERGTRTNRMTITPYAHVDKGFNYSYDFTHPVTINAILKWDMDELSDIVSRFGLSSNVIVTGGGDTPILVWRIIIDDHKKVETSVVKLPPLHICETKDDLKGW